MIYDSAVMKPKDIELPNYTRTQEIWNCITHAAGDVFALIAGPFLIVKAAKSGRVLDIVACSIFVFSLLCLYTFSALYHGLKPCTGKKVLRVMDHDMVFVLIMGTYAPYCLISLQAYSPAWCWPVFGCTIALGILGIVLNSCNIKKFAIFNFIDYILMGWLIVISMVPLSRAMGGFYPGAFLLLLGGISYTVGAVMYAIGKKHSPWWHTVFHVFVLLGTISMYFSIYFFVVK
jgi:hemolysin III